MTIESGILKLLAENDGTMTARQVHKTLEAQHGVALGQVYAAAGNMADQGLIELGGQQEPSLHGKPRYLRTYRLTPHGLITSLALAATGKKGTET